MSYARFGWEDSDVYVFLNVNGYLECCGCSSIEYKLDRWTGIPVAQEPFPKFKTVEGMLGHLEGHKEHGDTVPDSCIEELKADKESIEEFIKEKKYFDKEENE